MNIAKYRLPIMLVGLGALLVLKGDVLLATVGVDVSETKEAVSTKVSSAVSSNVKVQPNKASASTNVSKDKLEIDKLKQNGYSIKTVVSPFQTVANEKGAPNGLSAGALPAFSPLPAPSISSIGAPNVAGFGSGVPSQSSATPPTLKAIASSNAKSLAVINVNGKTATVQVGSTIDGIKVTDITEKSVTLVNNGVEQILELGKVGN